MSIGMDKDIKLALLGDHEAAKRLTEQGVLLPCPHGNGAEIYSSGNYWPKEYYRVISIPHCCMQSKFYESEHEARADWNTRAPILSAEEMEMLEGME